MKGVEEYDMNLNVALQIHHENCMSLVKKNSVIKVGANFRYKLYRNILRFLVEVIMDFESDLTKNIDILAEELIKISKDIWLHPEIGLKEVYSSNLLIKEFSKNNFNIKKDITNLPTAFVASFGEEKPIIGILGEYDALPALSQKVLYKEDPLKSGEPGHGCGHNLLGVGGLGAALALKNLIVKYNLKGTIRYYGCPAEELLIGKVLMAKEGVFNDLDAAISWHPSDVNTIWQSRDNACKSFRIKYFGEASHAAVSPELGIGKNTLDAAILTDIGINYLKGHISKDAKIHGIISNGGLVPNIIPAYSESWYFIRAPKKEKIEKIFTRVKDIIQGSNLMTQTESKIELITECYDFLPNSVLNNIILMKIKKIGPPKFTKKEKNFSLSLIRSFNKSISANDLQNPLCEDILDSAEGFLKGDIRPSSTDVGDVSHITPTGQFAACCSPKFTPPHSWQNTACSGSTIGFKGMIFASKVIALSVLEFFINKTILLKAKEEFYIEKNK